MASDSDEIRQLIDRIKAGPVDAESFAQQLVSAEASGHLLAAFEKFASVSELPVSRRRARRADPVMLRVRIDLTGASPPVWRRLELASDLFLHEVHEIVQAAFGWDDSHLHRFGCGPTYYSRETEYYLCPFSADEGDEGVPEEQVRLDEVLVDVGDKLFYLYDFGDDWEHVFQLEAVLARDASAPRAICTGGRRPGPPEDCGSIGGYELLVAATDPNNPDHATACAECANTYGPDVDPNAWAPTPFDIDEINRKLSEFFAV